MKSLTPLRSRKAKYLCNKNHRITEWWRLEISAGHLTRSAKESCPGPCPVRFSEKPVPVLDHSYRKTNINKQKSIFFFSTKFLHAQTVYPFFSLVTCSSIYFLYIFFLRLGLVRISCSSIQMSCCLLEFLLIRMDCSWSIKIKKESSFQDRIPWDFSRQIPEQTTVCPNDIQYWDPVVCLGPSSEDYEHHLVVTTDTAAFNLLIPDQCFLVRKHCKDKVQQNDSLHWLTCQAVVISVPRNLLDCLYPFGLSVQHVAVLLKSFTMTRACEHKTSSSHLQKAWFTSSLWPDGLKQTPTTC